MPPPLDGFRYDDEAPATSAAKPVTPTQSTPVALPGFRYDDEPAPTATATTPEPTPATGGLTGFRYDDEPVPPAQPVPAPVPVPPADNMAISGIYGDPDMPAMPVVDPNDKRQGGLDSMVAGISDAMREGRQLTQGDAFSRENIPPPVDRTFAGKIGYGFAHGTPTLAGMVLGAAGGAAAGSAVAPGPGTAVGGVLGGAAGGGLMDFAQSLIPAYQDATRRGLDHDAAVDEAYKVAASSGLLTGATAPLFALRPFKSTISNLLLHGAGTGPAIGAVKRGVIGPAVTGQPAPGIDEMISNALEDAIGGGLTMGAMHAGPAIARHFMPDMRPELSITPEPPLPGPRQITGAPGVAPEPPPVPPVPSTEPPPVPPPGPAPGVAPVVAVPPAVTPAPAEPTPTPGTPPNVIPPAIAPEPAPIVPPTVSSPVLPEPPVVAPTEPVGGVVPGTGSTGTVPVAPGTEPVAPGAPEPAPGGITAPVPAPVPVEQPGTVAGTTPETSALQPGAGEAAPTVPEPAQPGGIAEAIRELDKRNAPDDEYRSLLSTASKDELKPGETWRERAMRVAESQQPQETPAPPATDLTRLNPDDLHAELLRRSRAAQDAEDAYAASHAGTVGAPETQAAANALDAAEAAHKEALAAYDKLPDQKFIVTTRHYQGKTKKFTDQENTFTGKTATEVMDEQKRGIEKYSRETGRRAEIVSIRPAEAAPASPPTPAPVTPEPPATPGTPEPPARRPVTEAEQNQLQANLNKARAALNKATRDRTIKPLVWNAAHQKVLDAQAALDNAEGPPTKPMFIKAPPGAMEAHAAAVKAHEAAITQRVHTEGTAPVPAPKEAGKIFTMGKAGGQDAQVVRLSDPAGNQWVGTGSAITRESVLGSAAAKIEKLKTSVTRTLPPEAFEQAIAVKPGVDRYPVTWERQVTDTDGKVMVIGTLPDGTHVTVQKPIYDTLHAAAGKDGTITAANSKNDQRVFAHDAKGELVGVGMPMNLKQDLARTYARGAEPKAPEPVAPVVKSTPAPAPVPVPEPVPAKAAEPAPAPAKRQNVKVTDLKAGDIVTTPEGQIKTLTRVTQTRKDKQVTIYVEGEKRPWISPPGRVWTVHPAPEPTELEARQGAVARPQRKSAPVPGAPAPLPKRIRTLKTPESTPAPQAGAPMTQEDISYSAGTPRYQEAFIRAMAGTGMDPRTAMNKPLDEQVTMVTRALQDKYGFGRVDIVADGGAQLKLTRDQLLNMHQNMQGMAHAMNWPNEVLSLNGRLNLKLVPRNFEGKHWMGMYSPATKTIHVSGGSNSYAHEHWHAIDEYLSDLLNTDPNKATLFSHAARHDQLDANKTTHTAFANVLNTLFYDQGELALRRLALERTAAKTVAGQPTKEALEAQEQIRKLDTGASKLRIPPSMFRASAAQMPDPAYYASAHELVARAGEAYTAWAMRNAGVRTEGVVKPDEGYQNQLLAYMKAAYPNAQDRTNIFKAFGDLRTELERASVLPLKGPGALPPSDQHTVPPTHARPAEIGPGLMARIKADLQAIKWSNLRGGDHESVVSPGEQVQPPRIYTGKNNAPVEQTRGVRLADTLGEHWLSPLGNMERWIEQIPPKARPAMTKLRDMLGHDPGSGRLIDQTFEERARHQAQKATARLEDIFRDAGLVHRVTKRTHLTRTDQQDLWHTLATGDTTYPLDAHDTNKTGQTRPIRSEIIEAAKKIRLDIFEKSYDTAKASGLPIGHTKEGYVPRVMNDAKILSDPQTFTKDIARINGIIQDNDFAASNEEPPVRLAKWWSDTEKRVRDSPAAFTDEQRAAMNELVKNLNRINAINAELAAGGAVNPNAHNPAALQAERDTLEARNQDIHDEHGQGVLDAVALNEAQNMTRRIITGKPQDFTTLGPRSEFLRQRTLPPEADQVLRNWYVSDPKVAIPMYIHSMSRKLAYHEVFGPSGNNVTALIHEAQAAGMHGDHVRKFQDVVETVTGRSTRQGNSADTRIFNAISAWGELITMSGATLSALAEPTAMVLHGGSFKQVLKVYSNLMGQFFGTMEGAERMRIARQIGAISSVLQGSAMANRATDYSGTPVMGAIVNNFFELAMSPAIRMIRAATIGPSWSLLKELLEVANAPAKTNHELNRKDDAQRLLRDFGIADHQVGMMHDWAQTVTGEQPAPEQITNTKEGQLWEVVENRVLDRLNVNPTAAEKPMGALKTSYGNMMLGLTSFVWGFFRNGVLPAFRKIGHAGHRQYERAKTNGATDRQAWFQAKGSQLQYSLMAAVAAATLTLGTGMVGTARTYIFNQDAWAKHAEAGDLLPWLFGNAVSQSGLNGPLDLIGQAYHSLRYTSDLSNLTSGPFLATELRYAVDVVAMVNDIVSGEAKTNTKFYNGVHALLQLAGKPGALIGLTWLMRRLPAGGPLSALVTAASIGGVSTSVTRGITDQIAGPRGTTLPDEPKPGALPRLPDLPELPPLTPGEAKGAQHQETAMTAAIGIADDILMPIIQALPGPLKTAAVGAAAVATMGAAYYRGAQFREQGEPPKKHH